MGSLRKDVVLAILAAAFMSGAGHLYANPYFLYGRVFNPDGTSGTAATANSNCSLSAYRVGIPGQIGRQNSGPDATYPNKLYPAFYNGIDTPAYFYSDVGSTDWTTAPDTGQEIVAVFQAYAPQFAWEGASFVGCTTTVITIDDVNSKDFKNSMLKQIPQPVLIDTNNNNYINIGWTGMDIDLITGYTVYRSTEPGGNGGFGEIGTAAQVRNGEVIYNDAGLSAGYTYCYKLAVNFEWGGGNCAPDYYTTDAMSAVSAGVFTGPSPTFTESAVTQVPSPTYTATGTFTVTYTPTHTATPSATASVSPTFTYTITQTSSASGTPTYTITATGTPTYTETITPTLTPTYSATCTPTVTITPISALAVNLAEAKVIVFNDPIKDGKLSIGVYSVEDGTAVVYVYGINGELVRRTSFAVSAGPNPYAEEFKKAPGLYLLRTVISYKGNTQKLPIRKFAVIH